MLEDVTYSSMVQDGLQTLFDNLIKQQEDLVFQAILKEGLFEGPKEYLFERKRFPPIAVDIHADGSRYYYYNDGTNNGRFIMAFTKFEQHYDENKVTISFNVIPKELFKK